MAIFIKTGALARKTYCPISIFLSRPLYLYEQCRRLLQSSHEILLEAQMACDDHVRQVDVLCFKTPHTIIAERPGELHVNESGTDSAVQPVASQADTESNDEDVHSTSSGEDNILNDNAATEDAPAAAGQAGTVVGETSSAARPADEANNEADEAQQSSEPLEEDPCTAAEEENLNISALETTTSPHDDWLHRGPFLFDMDFHTYMRFTVRRPRPKDMKISDADRTEHVVLFDSHYALAASHWQHLDTQGRPKLVVMEALKCPPPNLNSGEDNAVFKSLIGTLIKCPGPGHCADPLVCKAGFFQVNVPESSTPTPASDLPDWIDHERFTPIRCPLSISRQTHADNVASTFSCRRHWSARRAEIDVLATQAAALADSAKRIPVLADITLFRAFHSGSAAQPAQSPPTWRYLLCFTQIWMSKSGQPFPPFAITVLEYLGSSMHHPHQMSLAQFSAYHLREIIYNLDMLAIARTTKLTASSKQQVEDETVEHGNVPGSGVETEFYGGEQAVEPDAEDIPDAEAWRPAFPLQLERLTAILSRRSEVVAASRKGRRTAAVMQMKSFDECFHAELHTPLPASTAKPQKPQLSYAHPHSVNAALLHQDAILKEMKNAQHSSEADMNLETDIGKAVLHNLQLTSRSAYWIDLATALKGPVHVAKFLVKKLHDARSKPDKPYRLNAEQLECTALFVEALEKPFARRPDLSKPWLHPAEVLMTILTDGGGGCGKTTLAVEVILPLLEAYYHPEGVLRRAPSNKPARLIGGRTMHSGQGLTPENSMRTACLALNAQSRQKLSFTHADAGVLYIDESSMLQGELNHAAALRTTYAREATYRLDRSNYSSPKERYGRIAILWYSQDHLQLPPVPESSSMLAPLEGTSNEHKVGAKIFRNAELVFQFNTAMRFTDEILMQILEAMRTPGGRRLNQAQWQALLQTQRSAEQSAVSTWHHVCYCWSVITMAAFMLARLSAQNAGQTLFYVQAVDQPLTLLQCASKEELHEKLLQIPSLSTTKRLPGVVLWHHGMRMRFTTTLQQPFAVQDVECTVVGFEPDDKDKHAHVAADAQHCHGEHVCEFMPKAIYVKIDDCDYHFLPPAPCFEHRRTGHDASCLNCISAVQPGIFAVKPLPRKFRYYYDSTDKSKYISVQRKQFPLMPALAMPLYSMQGTTADPGMVAYWFFPQRCSPTVKWLIVYVMLSRPRSLATLRSVGLTDKVRAIIEQGPPEELVATFHKLFDGKIKATKSLAVQAAKRYGLLPGLI